MWIPMSAMRDKAAASLCYILVSGYRRPSRTTVDPHQATGSVSKLYFPQGSHQRLLNPFDQQLSVIVNSLKGASGSGFRADLHCRNRSAIEITQGIPRGIKISSKSYRNLASVIQAAPKIGWNTA
jgi:hypothetical protein